MKIKIFKVVAINDKGNIIKTYDTDFVCETDELDGYRERLTQKYSSLGVYDIEFYKTERKTHPSFLRGWDVSDKR